MDSPGPDVENVPPYHADRPVPGVVIGIPELHRQQQELIRLQLRSAETLLGLQSPRPLPLLPDGRPDAHMLDASAALGYAPMEVDQSRPPSAVPASPRFPLRPVDYNIPDLLRARPEAPLAYVPQPPPEGRDVLPYAASASPPTVPPVPLPTAKLGSFDDPDFLNHGLAAERLKVVKDSDPTTVVLVHIYNGGAPKSNNIKPQSDSLMAALKAILPEPHAFVVVPPAADCGSHLPAIDQPTAWIVLRFTPEQAEYVLAGRVWTSRTITFIVYRPGPHFGRFVGRVGYFTHNIDDDIGVSIRRVFAGPAVRPSIRALVAARAGVNSDEVDPVVDYIVDHVEVDIVTYPNGNIIANVFCDSPSFLLDSYRAWIDYVRSVPIWCDLNPVGAFLRPVRCGGCLCADHPTFLCPLPATPGWLGPGPGTASIEGSPAAQLGVPTPSLPAARGAPLGRGNHPYRGGNNRGRRGRGRGAPL